MGRGGGGAGGGGTGFRVNVNGEVKFLEIRGGGGRRRRLGREGVGLEEVREDVNEELKFFLKIQKKKIRGRGWMGEGWWGIRVDVNEELKLSWK